MTAEAHGLPVPPERSVVVRESLPYASPLLEVVEISAPHVVVTVDEDRTDLVTVRHDDESQVDSVETDRERGFESLVEAVNAAARTVSAELAIVIAADLDRPDVEALQRFRFARSHDSVVEGVDDTVDALQAGRVRLLLIHDDPDDGGRAHSIPEHLGDGPAEGIGATLVT